MGLDKETVVSFIKTHIKKKQVWIPLAVSGLLVVGVSFHYAYGSYKQSKINFYSTLNEGVKLLTNKGTYRYTVEMQSGDIDIDMTTTDAKTAIENSKNTETDEIEGKSVLDTSRDTSSKFRKWTASNGVETEKASNDSVKFVITGVTQSIEPYTGKGSISFSSDTLKSGVDILDFVVLDGAWYIDIGGMRKNMLATGNEYLVSLAEKLPVTPSYVCFKDDKFIYDGVFGDGETGTTVDNADYIVERKKLIRLVSSLTDALEKSQKGIKPRFLEKIDTKYYFTVTGDNESAYKDSLNIFKSELSNAYNTYEDKCNKDNLFSDSYSEPAIRENFIDGVECILGKVDNMSEFQSVNWCRVSDLDSSGKRFELSSTLTWLDEEEERHLLSIKGEHKTNVSKDLEITEPKSYVSYGKLEKDTKKLAFSSIIKGLTAGKSEESTPEVDVNNGDTEKVEEEVK